MLHAVLWHHWGDVDIQVRGLHGRMPARNYATAPDRRPRRLHAGEITSRLAADTTTVSDQVCLNLNIMMRSATQAAVVLTFMFAASWRLTVVTFILIPVVLLISKVRGTRGAQQPAGRVGLA